MPRYANVDKLMEHAIRLDWSVLKWVNEVDISTAINPNVVEVKHGRWIGGEIDYCSCCGHKGCASDIWDFCKDGEYCPNCGAKMDGKEAEK